MKKYAEKELKSISKELALEDLKQVQELSVKRLEASIEEMMLAMDQRMRRLEQNQQGLKKLLLEMIDKISGEVIEFKKVSKDEAGEVVKNYVSSHPGCLTSEIIQNLQLAPEIVVEVLEELTNKGEIKGKDDNE